MAPNVPREPVGMTVHSMPAPDPAELERRTRSGRWKMLLVLAVCASPVMASYFTYFVIRPEGRTNYATLIQPTRTLPAQLPITTVSGKAMDPQQLRRQWLLISLADANCGPACEERLLMQRQVHQMLGKERDRLDKIWIIADGGTPDPRLVEAQTTGVDPATVLRVPRAALAAWLQPADGQVLDDHLYIVDPMGEWMMRVPPKPDPMRLKRDLERLLRASSSWDTAGR